MSYYRGTVDQESLANVRVHPSRRGTSPKFAVSYPSRGRGATVEHRLAHSVRNPSNVGLPLSGLRVPANHGRWRRWGSVTISVCVLVPASRTSPAAATIRSGVVLRIDRSCSKLVGESGERGMFAVLAAMQALARANDYGEWAAPGTLE